MDWSGCVCAWVCITDVWECVHACVHIHVEGVMCVCVCMCTLTCVCKRAFKFMYQCANSSNNWFDMKWLNREAIGFISNIINNAYRCQRREDCLKWSCLICPVSAEDLPSLSSGPPHWKNDKQQLFLINTWQHDCKKNPIETMLFQFLNFQNQLNSNSTHFTLKLRIKFW